MKRFYHKENDLSKIPGGTAICIIYDGYEDGDEIEVQHPHYIKNYVEAVIRSQPDLQKIWVKETGMVLFEVK